MARSWIAVQVAVTRRVKWRRLSPAARGALLTFWLDFAAREEDPWRSLEELTEHLALDGFSPAVVEELARNGWLDHRPGVAPHDWADWQAAWFRSVSREADAARKRDAYARKKADAVQSPEDLRISPLSSATSPLLSSDSLSSSSTKERTENVIEGGPGGGSDPFLDGLMGVLGAVPSPKALAWADRLAADHGEAATLRAIATAAMKDPTGRRVLSMAEAELAAAVIRRERAEVKRKEAEIAQARDDRTSRQRAEQQGRVTPSGPVTPLRELIGEVQFLQGRPGEEA